MSRHFCWCIPVRVAVFILSLLSLLASALVAAAAWAILAGTCRPFTPRRSTLIMIYSYDADPSRYYTNFTSSDRTIDIVVGAVYTIVAVFSLFGYVCRTSFGKLIT